MGGMGLLASDAELIEVRPSRSPAAGSFLHLVRAEPTKARSLPALTEDYIRAVDSKIEEIELPANGQSSYDPHRMLGLDALFDRMFRKLIRPLTSELPS